MGTSASTVFGEATVEELSLDNYGIGDDDGMPKGRITGFLERVHIKQAKDAVEEFHSVAQDIIDILEKYERSVKS